MRWTVWIYIFARGQYLWSGFSYPPVDQEGLVYRTYAILGPAGRLQSCVPWSALSGGCSIWRDLGCGMWYFNLSAFQVDPVCTPPELVDRPGS